MKKHVRCLAMVVVVGVAVTQSMLGRDMHEDSQLKAFGRFSETPELQAYEKASRALLRMCQTNNYDFALSYVSYDLANAFEGCPASLTGNEYDEVCAASLYIIVLGMVKGDLWRESKRMSASTGDKESGRQKIEMLINGFPWMRRSRDKAGADVLSETEMNLIAVALSVGQQLLDESGLRPAVVSRLQELEGVARLPLLAWLAGAGDKVAASEIAEKFTKDTAKVKVWQRMWQDAKVRPKYPKSNSVNTNGGFMMPRSVPSD